MKVNEHGVLASLCRASFFDFVKEFWHVIVEDPLHLNWHIEYLCNEMQELAERTLDHQERAYDLLINIPPGSSKSTLVSQMFNAWVWARRPSAQFICVSYSYPIAMKDALKCRDLVESEQYRACFPGVQLRADANTKGLFINRNKGFRLSAGVGGSVTGFHGHFLLVDDPLNPEQSYSEPELKVVNRWMRTTLPSRRLPKNVAPIILVGQRLHQADPSGEMLERYSGHRIKHICLPGEDSDKVSPPELRKKYQDGLLDPIRLSRPVLQDLEKELGPYGYASQVGQDPVPMGGGMIEVDRLNILDEAPKMVEVVRSWDKAGTEGAGAFSVGAKMGRDEQGRFWILDIVRGQWGTTKRERNILETAERDGVSVPIRVEIEGGSGGKESGENTLRSLAGYTVIAYHPTGDKVTRAYPLATQVGAGNVYCLNRAWTKALIDEMRFFPYSRYKDQVDTLSDGFSHLARKKKKIGGAW